jgi:hypothetical protein
LSIIAFDLSIVAFKRRSASRVRVSAHSIEDEINRVRNSNPPPPFPLFVVVVVVVMSLLMAC